MTSKVACSIKHQLPCQVVKRNLQPITLPQRKLQTILVHKPLTDLAMSRANFTAVVGFKAPFLFRYKRKSPCSNKIRAYKSSNLYKLFLMPSNDLIRTSIHFNQCILQSTVCQCPNMPFFQKINTVQQLRHQLATKPL